MKLVTSLLPLQKLKPTASRWNFSESALETAAQLVFNAEGIVNPLVVEPESASYRILDGNFEYYALALANQLDHHRCKAVEAFVIDPQEVDTIQQQIVLLRNATTGLPQRLQPDLRYAASPPTNSPLAVTAPNFKHLLDIFNYASAEQLLSQLQQIGLTGKNADKVIDGIKQARQQQPFDSLKQVVNRVKGLTCEKMLDLIETLT